METESITSRPSFIDPSSTLASLCEAHPEYTAVFERFGIDYCCGGARSLSDAVARAGLSLDAIIDALLRAAPRASDAPRIDAMNVEALVAHIVDRHHAYTRDAIARLVPLAEKVARVHNAAHPELLRVRTLVQALADDLGPHLLKEERVLFPAAIDLERARAAGVAWRFAFGSVRSPIAVMQGDHENVGGILEALRATTRGYALPEDACQSYRSLYRGLVEFEADLHEHIHLENNVLFHRLVRLEAQPVPSARP